MDSFHTSVLLKETVEHLNVARGKRYIDATLGGGGHALAILKNGGEVLAIDLDLEALSYVKNLIDDKDLAGRLKLVKGNFKDIGAIAKREGFSKVNGIVFDLGVSSHQIDTAERGFSFLKDGPLDMRMDKDSSLNAEYLINVLEKEKLYEIFKNYGQESRASGVANSIIKRRKMKAIQTTNDLVDVIKEAYGFKGVISDFQKNRISQKVFQAIRIAVNNEFENIRLALAQSLGLLETKGALCVISFHSLEDRIIKNAFRDFEGEGLGFNLTKKPIVATEYENNINSRAKSAKLRVFIRK